MATAVLVNGPFPNANARSDWDEFPEWVVGTVNDEGEDVGKIYYCHSFDAAVKLGEKMAKDRNLEFVMEADPWF